MTAAFSRRGFPDAGRNGVRSAGTPLLCSQTAAAHRGVRFWAEEDPETGAMSWHKASSVRRVRCSHERHSLLADGLESVRLRQRMLELFFKD